jgi:hypothetical protein
VASHIGVGQEVINEVMITALNEAKETAATLKLEVESEGDVFLLLEKARDTLGHLSERVLHWRYVEAILQEAKKLEQSLKEMGSDLGRGGDTGKSKA